MALFQKSVLNKYIEAQERNIIEKQYALFKNYFHNTTIQKNIIASKEEEFQEGFLRELFVNILGYTINPEPNYNLVTELKNEKDSKKADGAIISMGLSPLSNNKSSLLSNTKSSHLSQSNQTSSNSKTKKLSLSQESEWLQYFEEQKQNVLSIKTEIDKTDKEIDQMVYKLYDLTEDEIKIVEEN